MFGQITLSINVSKNTVESSSLLQNKLLCVLFSKSNLFDVYLSVIFYVSRNNSWRS